MTNMHRIYRIDTASNTIACWLALLSWFVIGYKAAQAKDSTPSQYRLIEIGTPEGTNSVAYALNDLGQVVGDYDLPTGGRHAFVYSAGVVTDLGTLGGTISSATFINSRGQIMGFSTSYPGGPQDHFIYSNGQMRNADLIVDDAAQINDAGQILITHSGSITTAALYSEGISAPLGTLGGVNTFAFAMNNFGQIVGSSGVKNKVGTPTDFPSHAFSYVNGRMTDLGVLGGGPNSYAYGVNDQGDIVGKSDFGNVTTSHAFLYQSGSMIDLGTAGNNYSLARAINLQHQVVGEMGSGTSDPSAFLYSDFKMYDVNQLLDTSGNGWHVTEAWGINYDGWIAGVARAGDGHVRAVLLVPVPEPAAIGLAAICALTFVGGRSFVRRTATSI